MAVFYAAVQYFGNVSIVRWGKGGGGGGGGGAVSAPPDDLQIKYFILIAKHHPKIFCPFQPSFRRNSKDLDMGKFFLKTLSAVKTRI